MEKNKENEDTISLLDILIVLIKNRKLIFFIPLIALLVILVIAISSIILPSNSGLNFLPNIFKPGAIVMLKKPGESQGGFSSLLNSGGSQLDSLVSMLGGNVGFESADLSNLIKVLLETNEIMDIIINEFNFVKKYKIKKFVKTDSRKIFKKNISVEVKNQSNTIVINYTDIDPVFATEVVNRVVEELEKKVKSLYLEKTMEKKSFLEERIDVKETELEKLQNKLIDYQRKYGIVNVSSQADKSISFLANLQAEVINKELELKTLEKNASYDKTRIEYLQYELSLTKNLIEELRKGGNEYSNEFIPLDKLPELAKEYLNLNKDVTIQGLILEMLKQQYEAVKLEESDKSQTFNVLEWAEIPEIKNGPKRSLIVIIVTVIAFVISVFIAFIKEYISNIKKDPVESKKLDYIKGNILILKRKK